MSLSQSEASLLECLERMGGKADAAALASKLGLPESSIFPLSSLLSTKGYVTLTEEVNERFRLTEEGERCAKEGMPETRVMGMLESRGGSAPLTDVSAALRPNEVSAALGWGRKTGAFAIERRDATSVLVLKAAKQSELDAAIRRMKEGGDTSRLSKEDQALAVQLKSRGLLEMKEVKRLTLAAVPGKHAAEVSLNLLSSEIIRSGRWKEVTLRPYDVRASPPSLKIGKRHPYIAFLEETKEIFISMGFEETSGPFVETEFWNFDVLFQAQDHPARAIHDSFQVRGVEQGIDAPEDLVQRVKATHESGGGTGSRGWGYSWDLKIAAQPLLRTQMTVESVRYLASHKEPPVKAFSLSKVFRPDVIDARHMIEFSQLDGIVGGEGINVRHLLGVLKEFGHRLGFDDIKFKPSYFPFTEPSIEAYIKHPTLGWIECLGSGLFRPEVLAPLGIKFPVIAWGIGIDRFAMIRLGLNDIRDLNTTSLEKLRQWGWW